MDVGLGLRARFPRWPLSPAAEGPAIVIGEVHHPVKPEESRAPEWLMIPPPKRVPPQVVTSLREPVSPTQLRDRVVGIVSVTVLGASVIKCW